MNKMTTQELIEALRMGDLIGEPEVFEANRKEFSRRYFEGDPVAVAYIDG